MSSQLQVVNCSPYGSRLWPFVKADEMGWRWIADRCPADWRWNFVTAAPESWLERKVHRPELSRYRACWEAAQASTERPGLLVTHGPLMTWWTELARSVRRRVGMPHIAFSFNFTTLPKKSVVIALMRRAFRRVDAFFVYSTVEKSIYSRFFGIPESKFHMIHWGSQSPEVDGLPGLIKPFIAAVGGQGRDYALLADAMRQLPDITLEIVGSAESVEGVDFPSNVRVRVGLPMRQVHELMAASEFLVLPLRDTRVPCGHVTVVTAMQLGKPTLATRSPGIEDYVIPGLTGDFFEPLSHQSLATKIAQLWNAPQRISSLGQSAQQFASKRCSEQNVATQFQHVACMLAVANEPPSLKSIREP